MFAYMIEKRLAGWQPFLYAKNFYQAIDNNSQLGYIIFRLSLRHLFQAWRRRTGVKALLKYNTQQERRFVLLIRIAVLVFAGKLYSVFSVEENWLGRSILRKKPSRMPKTAGHIHPNPCAKKGRIVVSQEIKPSRRMALSKAGGSALMKSKTELRMTAAMAVRIIRRSQLRKCPASEVSVSMMAIG